MTRSGTPAPNFLNGLANCRPVVPLWSHGRSRQQERAPARRVAGTIHFADRRGKVLARTAEALRQRQRSARSPDAPRFRQSGSDFHKTSSSLCRTTRTTILSLAWSAMAGTERRTGNVGFLPGTRLDASAAHVALTLPSWRRISQQTRFLLLVVRVSLVGLALEVAFVPHYAAPLTGVLRALPCWRCGASKCGDGTARLAGCS